MIELPDEDYVDWRDAFDYAANTDESEPIEWHDQDVDAWIASQEGVSA